MLQFGTKRKLKLQQLTGLSTLNNKNYPKNKSKKNIILDESINNRREWKNWKVFKKFK